MIALCSLLFAGIPLVTALGLSAAHGRVRRRARRDHASCRRCWPSSARASTRCGSRSAERKDDDGRPHGWARWAHGVADHPWVAGLSAVAILVVLSLPLLDLRLGQEDVGQLPTSTTARQAYDALRKGFGDGANGPFLVAAKLDPPAHNDQKKLNKLNDQVAQQQQQATQVSAWASARPTSQSAAAAPAAAAAEQQKKFLESTASDPRLTGLEKDISKAHGIDTVSQAKVSNDGTGAVFSVTPVSAPSAYSTQDDVRELRDTVIPAATKGEGMTAYVGGTTAAYIDLADRISDKLVSVIAIVVALSFLLLMLAFRSLLVPLTGGG